MWSWQNLVKFNVSLRYNFKVLGRKEWFNKYYKKIWEQAKLGPYLVAYK